ncbi:RDD family protein [Streptomyces sp. NPDC052496]|uniref:RDD family protein n=1 Tax=Streptomyces sp. NPDC052496 TaxID=3154951 RepID=UPI0034298F12
MKPSPPVGTPARLQGRTAGLVSRTLAALTDALAVLGIAVLTGLAVGAVRFLVFGPPFTAPRPSDQLTGAFGFCLAVGYLAAGWSVTGRTVGGRLMGVRVVQRSGRRLRPGRALFRAVLCVLLPLGLFWAPLSRRDASVADLVVRSAVVYDWYGGRRGRGERGGE